MVVVLHALLRMVRNGTRLCQVLAAALARIGCPFLRPRGESGIITGVTRRIKIVKCDKLLPEGHAKVPKKIAQFHGFLIPVIRT
jgi:hypothetical protein